MGRERGDGSRTPVRPAAFPAAGGGASGGTVNETDGRARPRSLATAWSAASPTPSRRYALRRGGGRGQPLPVLPRRAVRHRLPDRHRHSGLHPQDRHRQPARLGAHHSLGQPARLLVRASARSRCCASARACTTTGIAIRRSRSAGCSATRSRSPLDAGRATAVLRPGDGHSKVACVGARVRPRSAAAGLPGARRRRGHACSRSARWPAGSTPPVSRPTRCTSRARCSRPT